MMKQQFIFTVNQAVSAVVQEVLPLSSNSGNKIHNSVFPSIRVNSLASISVSIDRIDRKVRIQNLESYVVIEFSCFLAILCTVSHLIGYDLGHKSVSFCNHFCILDNGLAMMKYTHPIQFLFFSNHAQFLQSAGYIHTENIFVQNYQRNQTDYSHIQMQVCLTASSP